MRRLFVLAVVLFALPAHAVTIDWVTVGDPGNAADDTGYGSVAYTYRISKYEVTNAQYVEFLNAVADTDTYGLYNTSMGSGYGGITRSGSSGSYTYSTIAGREDMPVNYVSFYDALRFANWLHNGQGGGDTETGAYTITAQGIADGSITRNEGATIVLTSEDEWYKAAYFNGTSYFDYPAGSDLQTTCAAAGATANTANCNAAVGDLTDVGSYTGSASPYGTFDQGGNVSEWMDDIYAPGATVRIGRGGNFNEHAGWLASGAWGIAASATEGSRIGFRVASLPDSDGDGIADAFDNCLDVPNGPWGGVCYIGGVQLDGNQDGYGNPCDMDFDDDGLHTGADVGPFISAIGASDPRADINCDGLTTGADVGPGIAVLGASPAPGPSGLSCAGTIPCP